MVELENSETRLHSIYFIHNFTTLAIKTDDFHIVPSDNRLYNFILCHSLPIKTFAIYDNQRFQLF